MTANTKTKDKQKKIAKSPLAGADFTKILAGPPPTPQQADPKLSILEKRAFEREDEKRQLQNHNYRHTVRLRRELARSIPRFVKGYLVFVGILLIGNSISLPPDSLICRKFFCIYFELSDNVIIALLTTTTVNVIGLYVIVAKYIFSPHLDGNK